MVDKNATLKERVEAQHEKAVAILNGMRTHEKIKHVLFVFDFWKLVRDGLTGNYNRSPFEVGVLRFSDGPGGTTLGESTAFPKPITLAATWDTELAAQMGEVIALEILAQGGNAWTAPVIDLGDPRDGRTSERFGGQDAYFTGEMAAAIVEAAQAKGVITFAKHWPIYQSELNRTFVKGKVAKDALYNQYLRTTRRLIAVGIGGFMTAYSHIDGTIVSEHEELLDILQNEMGFSGLLINDYLYGAESPAKFYKRMDVAMADENFAKMFRYGFRAGDITEEDLDRQVLHILKVVLAFEETQAEQPPKSIVACDAHVALAYHIAVKGCVLLKNTGVLPIKPNKKLAIIGNRLKHQTGDEGSSYVKQPEKKTVAILDAFERKQSFVEYLFSLPYGFRGTHINYSNGRVLSHAIRMAREAEAAGAPAILTLGIKSAKGEGEGYQKKGSSIKIGAGDRKMLELDAFDLKLIDAVTKVNSQVIVVLMGSSFAIGDWADKVQAIVYAGYPGMQGGNAIRNLLFGHANFSGRLPLSFAKKTTDFGEHNPRADTIEYRRYTSGLYLQKEGIEPAYPFGYGESYAVFTSSPKSVEVMHDLNTVLVTVQVSNAGMIGEEVIQVYQKVENVHELCGWKKVTVKTGETVTIGIPIRFKDLERYNVEVGEWVLNLHQRLFVGTSSALKDLIEFEVYLGF